MNPLSLIFGLIIAAIGTVFLGINLGWWSQNVWLRFAAFWPVILIVLGLRFLIRDNRIFSVVTIILLALIFWFAATNPQILSQRTIWRPNVTIPPIISGEESTFSKSQEVASGDSFRADLGGRYDISIVGGDATSIVVDLRGPKEVIDNLLLEKQGSQIVLEARRFNGFRLWGTLESVTGTITIPRNIPLSLDTSGLTKVAVSNYEGTLRVEGSGATYATFQNSNSLSPTVNLSGTGKINLDRCQGEADFDVSGAGEITAASCDLTSLMIDASGSSKIDIKSGGVIDLTVHSSGASSLAVPKPSGRTSQSSSGASSIRYYGE